MKYLLAFLLFTPVLFAESIDPLIHHFEQRQQVKRVDRFDFSGAFPNLENIDIDARRKKRVEFDLSGDYPLLSTVNYEGSFGHLRGELTGNYPHLSLVNLFCTRCAMQLDLNGAWQKSCQINIRGEKEDIILKLPEGIGLIVNTTSSSGKVVANQNLKKQGWFQLWKKTYQNELAQTADIVLTIDIENTKGTIILN